MKTQQNVSERLRAELRFARRNYNSAISQAKTLKSFNRLVKTLEVRENTRSSGKSQ